MSSPLRNLLSPEEALQKVLGEQESRKTLSFYWYFEIANPGEYRDRLFAVWDAIGVLGRIYVAGEGINAQISVPQKNWESFVGSLTDFGLEGIRLNIAVEHHLSFIKLKIKVKAQIVADNLPLGSYDMQSVGTHLRASEFNLMIEQGANVVDMRNHYESRIGAFQNAYCPPAVTFRDELPLVREKLAGKENEKVLLYCTGGIRCEKASAYLKAQGFKNVYQLEGGVIKYAHDVKKEEISSLFRGKNFVFDGRMSERVTADILSFCDICGKPGDDYHNCANLMCHRLMIACPECVSRFRGTCSTECCAITELPEDEYKKLRSGTKSRGLGQYQRSKGVG
ncbi:MAG: UPF0176 protein [Parcubacteria group bacterium Gr01-1014_18]|nr:MAG: UPF0176 protein [Parcubacteria group bacterium Greene0416_36]TSC81553.1 MAG: UPF0176 protein [Parcubacteria group bacterium Gr01-1014_18]TSC99636.1 MAG: UPF0176 protein [Parcubacteria group bacterium Greene1014_20]TSD07087.1 MAG: UPF0176 protein [Parcubacteria group bacterium Greene0714_2]